MDLFSFLYQAEDFGATLVNCLAFISIVEFIGAMFTLIGNIRR